MANGSAYVEEECFVAENSLYQLALLCSLPPCFHGNKQALLSEQSTGAWRRQKAQGTKIVRNLELLHFTFRMTLKKDQKKSLPGSAAPAEQRKEVWLRGAGDVGAALATAQHCSFAMGQREELQCCAPYCHEHHINRGKPDGRDGGGFVGILDSLICCAQGSC